jgi:hypothetical protein
MATAEIMTLEGLGAARPAHSRSCLAVGSNRSGKCQCIRFGAPGEGRDFKTLCKQAGIPMKIGQTNISGFDGYEDDAPPPLPMEYPAIEDLGFLSETGILPTGEEMKETLTAAGALAASVVAVAFIAKKININPWIKIVGTGVVGLSLGNVLARKVSRPVGLGVGVGLVGLALATAFSKLTKLSVSLEDGEEDEVRRELTDIEVLPEETMLAPLSQIDTDYEQRYGSSQMGEAVGVETERKLTGWDEAVGVETETKLSGVGSWIGG